jgi:hypothetical protein
MLDSTAMDDILLSYKLTEKDLLEVYAKVLRIPRTLQIAGAFLVVYGLASLIGHRGSYYEAVSQIVVGLLFVFCVRLLVKFSFKRDFAKHQGTKTIISSEGIAFSDSNSQSTSKWSAFIRYAETKNLFMLFYRPNLCHTLPKRAFAPEDLSRFRELLQQNVPVQRAKNTQLRMLVFWVVLLVAVFLVWLAVKSLR